MTIEQKQEKIEKFCIKTRCTDCPLFAKSSHHTCWSELKYVEEHYAILFGKDTETKEEMPDNVNHPSHYETGKFECIDVMIETQGVEAVKHFCICNAFKYLYRHNGKNGVEDIKKAKWYIDKHLELEGESHE